jgi:hypothetical protein
MKKVVDPRALRRPPRLSDFQDWEDRIDAEFRKISAKLDKIVRDIAAKEGKGTK